MSRLRRIGKTADSNEDMAAPQATDTGGGADAAGLSEERENGVALMQPEMEAEGAAAVPDAVPEMEAIDAQTPPTEEANAPEAVASLEGATEAHDVVEAAPEAFEGQAAEDVPAAESVAAEAADAESVGDDTAEGTRAGAGQTVPFDHLADAEELTALPANAVVSGKYVVQSQLHHSTERNLYRVAPRRQQKCQNCGRLSSADAMNCEVCGEPLTNLPPAEFYLMAESFRPDSLMLDPSLMDLHLYHPNLVPVVDFFDYKPFGRTRYYAVAEPRQGVRLSQLSMPRPALQVFGWGLQLADALDYLHSRGVIGAGAESDDILVQGDTASLASLQNARYAVEDSEDRRQHQSLDLAKLAATIYEAYTGYPAAMSPEGILPMPSQAPDKAATAFRMAIGAVQGTEPPISAARWRDLLSAALIAVAELEQPGRPVDFVSASLTDVGRLREQNQDSYCTTEFLQSSVERPTRVGLYVIADGMGGHKGGEIASAIAAQAFAAEVMARVVAPLSTSTGSRPTLSNEAILQGMTRAVQTANERIYKARDSRQNDMGTTLVAALVANGKAYIINVGDSRLYAYTHVEKGEGTTGPMAGDTSGTGPMGGTAPLESGTAPLKSTATLEEADEAQRELALARQREEYELTQISVDHSLVHRLVELGQLDPEEAKVHPHRNFIYRSLGGPPPIDVDTFVRTLHPGDRILLCSDGLNSMIEDEDIESVLASERDPLDACRKLIEAANEAGGHDNISTILIDITGYLPLPEHPQALANT